MTVQDFKNYSKKELASSPSADLDSQILLSHFLGLSKTELLLGAKEEIPEEKLSQLDAAVQSRKKGLPVAYITNHREFYGYDFYVNQSVLIPKPDSEILVENAVEFLSQKIKSSSGRILTVCDMCAGSGCIGISVLKSLYEKKKIPLQMLPKFTLADISLQALEIARKNADALLLFGGNGEGPRLRERLRLVQSNLFELLPYQFDAVLANPPYVPKSLTDQLLGDGRSEPRLALDGDVTISGDHSQSDDGLEIIRNLMPQLGEHIAPGGFFLMEAGEYNMRGAETLSYRAGFRNSRVFRDLEGQERVLYAER